MKLSWNKNKQLSSFPQVNLSWKLEDILTTKQRGSAKALLAAQISPLGLNGAWWVQAQNYEMRQVAKHIGTWQVPKSAQRTAEVSIHPISCWGAAWEPWEPAATQSSSCSEPQFPQQLSLWVLQVGPLQHTPLNSHQLLPQLSVLQTPL